MRWLSAAVLVGAMACNPPVETPDASTFDGGELEDAGHQGDADGGVDAGHFDAGGLDASIDAGTIDAGLPDAGTVDAGQPDAGTRDAGPDAGMVDAGLVASDGGTRVRVIAANLTSGNGQNYDLGHGQRILQALQGDVIAIQEFNYGSRSPTDIRAFVDATFGPSFSYVRGSGNIPNGVVSRFPILDGGEWDDSRTTDREFTWALIDLPGADDLVVVSVHLLSNTSTNRNLQGTQLLQYLDANFPGAPHVVIGGDFNTDVRGEMVLGTFGSKLTTTGPWPVDQQGNGSTNMTRSRPYDWVLATPRLDRLEVPAVLGSDSFPTGLVFDTRVHTPLPAPALFGDSAATAMQHMAVVRDFVVP